MTLLVCLNVADPLCVPRVADATSCDATTSCFVSNKVSLTLTLSYSYSLSLPNSLRATVSPYTVMSLQRFCSMRTCHTYF